MDYEEFVAERNGLVLNLIKVSNLCRQHSADVADFIAEHGGIDSRTGAPLRTEWSGAEVFGWLGY